MLNKLLLAAALASPKALADTPDAPDTSKDHLATAAECKGVVPEGKTCVGDVQEFVRLNDGLSYMTNNLPYPGTGFELHHEGGLDRTPGPEDTDGKVSAEEFVQPRVWVNRPWQTPICSTADNAAIDLSVSRGEVPADWVEQFKVKPDYDSADGFGVCFDAAVPEITTRRMNEEVFQPRDVNKDGFISLADDRNNDNMITAEDILP